MLYMLLVGLISFLVGYTVFIYQENKLQKELKKEEEFKKIKKLPKEPKFK